MTKFIFQSFFLLAKVKEMGRVMSRVTMKKLHLSVIIMKETAVYKEQIIYQEYIYHIFSQSRIYTQRPEPKNNWLWVYEI